MKYSSILFINLFFRLFMGYFTREIDKSLDFSWTLIFFLRFLIFLNFSLREFWSSFRIRRIIDQLVFVSLLSLFISFVLIFTSFLTCLYKR